MDSGENALRQAEGERPIDQGAGQGVSDTRSEDRATESIDPHPHSFPLLGKEASRGAEGARAQLNIEWCERRLLARIHRYTVERLRAEIEPVSAADYMRFLFEWHGLTIDPQSEGPQALATVIEQLEGFEAACVAWESDILPARTNAYDPDWIDGLCRAGRVVWTRLTPPRAIAGRQRAAAPVRTTPIALVTRKNLRLWQSLPPQNGDEAPQMSSRAQNLAEFLKQHGASFFEEITTGAHLLKSEAEDALRELVALGMVQSDSYSGLRTLLLPADKRRDPRRRRRGLTDIEDAGRWSLLRRNTSPNPTNEGNEGGNRTSPANTARDSGDIETAALTLLRRYGVVFRRILTREPDWLPSWFELLRVYRRLEARGEIRGGRFVEGFAGEQYALPEAVSLLRATRKKPITQQWISLSAADPLNLVGIITPGARVPAFATNRVLYRDGIPVAIQTGGKTEFIQELPVAESWTARNALLRPWANRRQTHADAEGHA